MARLCFAPVALAAFVALGSAAAGAPQTHFAPALRTAPPPGDWLGVYDPYVLRRMHIEISAADYATIRFDETFDIEVPAVFWLDGDVGGARYDISIRRKSATPIGEKISYRLKFVAQQGAPSNTVWYGIRSLSLENGDDQDVVREGLSWLLHRFAAGTSTTYSPGLASWTELTLHIVGGQGSDVRPQGVYLSVELPDKRFLQRRGLWHSDATWLYKQDDIGVPELKESPGADHSPTYTLLDYSPFRAGHNAPPPPSDSALFTQLSEWIDMDSMLRLGAVNAYTDNPDELWNKGKNFFWFDYGPNVADKRRQYIPWDLDASIRTTTANIYTAAQGGNGNQHPYQNVLLNHPQYRVQYNQLVLQLLDGPLRIERIQMALDRVEAMLSAALVADPNSKITDPPEYFDSLRAWIAQRDANVRAFVAANGPPAPRD